MAALEQTRLTAEEGRYLLSVFLAAPPTPASRRCIR